MNVDPPAEPAVQVGMRFSEILEEPVEGRYEDVIARLQPEQQLPRGLAFRKGSVNAALEVLKETTPGDVRAPVLVCPLDLSPLGLAVQKRFGGFGTDVAVSRVHVSSPPVYRRIAGRRQP